MLLSSNAQANESFYLKEAQKLLPKIEEAIGEAVDSVNSFDIKTNADKICISTVANNFSQDLEYTVNNLQRTTIENHTQGDDNKNLKEAIQIFSTFVHRIQLAFGNDLNKLKLEIINVLQNLVGKLNPLLDNDEGNSPYSSKREIASILDYLYIAIVKVKLRTQWEHFDQAEIQKAYAYIIESKIGVLEKLQDKEEYVAHFRRTNREAVEGILHVLEQLNVDIDDYDDKIRDPAESIIAKIADSIFGLEKALRSKKKMSELLLYTKICTINIVPSAKELLELLNSEDLLDSNGIIKNHVLNTVINVLGCSIRFFRTWQRILKN